MDTYQISAENKLVPIKALSKQTGIGRTKIYEEIASGRLLTVKASGKRLVSQAEITRWAKSQLDMRT